MTKRRVEILVIKSDGSMSPVGALDVIAILLLVKCDVELSVAAETVLNLMKAGF